MELFDRLDEYPICYQGCDCAGCQEALEGEKPPGCEGCGEEATTWLKGAEAWVCQGCEALYLEGHPEERERLCQPWEDVG